MNSEKYESVYDIYYDWLLNRVMYYDMRSAGRDYSILLKKLHSIQFVPIVEQDRNRANDGKYMRFIFGEESAIWDEIKGSCTFLEMLVGLAYRINEDIFEVDPTASLARWFWMMMENCGLDEYENYIFDEEKVAAIVQKIIERKYQKSGKGGLFPLKNVTKDQRKVEIWYQMQSYIMENFDF